MLDRVQHPIRLRAPQYAATNGVQLHRYLGTDFIPMFRQELEGGRAAGSAGERWQGEVAFSGFDDRPVLALPIHHTYFVVSVAVTCDRLGQPALDPARIVSAGFAIRRVGDSDEQCWMLEDGKPLGWRPTAGEQRDPDLSRRLCLNGVLRRGRPTAAYSGEETHPLHVAHYRDSEGRRRTVLYGYLPLGGSYYETGEPFAAASVDDVLEFAGEALPHPFGYRGTDETRNGWSAEDARPVNRGRPSSAFFELLELLVNRYHLGESGIAANAALEAWADGVHFYDDRSRRWGGGPLAFSDQSRGLFRADREFSLLSYLEACFREGADNPLVEWLVEQRRALDAAGGIESDVALARLPDLAPRRGSVRLSLYLSTADAQELRALLGQRLLETARSKAREIPIPKFRQRREDIYQVVPFLRARDLAGKERITWAADPDRSMTFRVAAPFDPDVSRPSMIQMPGLKDLKRGLAKGASMITPADTFNVIRAMKMNKGASEDVLPESTPSDGLGIQWICSFSLPVITLVAMILLMIMISLLNIVFFWLPWVRICLPFPKTK